MRISDWSSDVCSSDLAMRYKLFLAAGTTPVRSQRGMRNSGHLYTPSGGIYTQEKLHVTPAEREYWGIVPGEGIRVFETPIGRIAIVICYDIELPEQLDRSSSRDRGGKPGWIQWI